MNQASHTFKALSDDTRLRIMSLLMKGELCVCDIMEVLKLPQSTASRHLAYLRNAGLVSGHRRGLWMFYRLVDVDEGLRSGLITLLRESIAELPLAEEDSHRLRKYLSQKRTSCC